MENNTTINIGEIILSSDDNFKKDIVANYEKYDIDPFDVSKIVESINDDDYKITFIKNANRNIFRKYQITDIVISISDDSCKKEVIKDRRKYFIDGDPNLLRIIFSMDNDAVNDILLNYRDYSFPSTTLCNIIRSIKDDKTKKNIILNYKYYNFNDFDIAKVTASINDDKYKMSQIKKMFKSSYFEPSCIATIATSFNDEIYKYIVFNNYKKYNFKSNELLSIVESFRDDRYIYKIIDDIDNYDFDKDTFSSIVSYIKDDFYKTNLVIDNIYDFDFVQLTRIVDSIMVEDVKQQLMEFLYNRGYFGTSNLNKSIVLPEDMSVGIEIETEGENSNIINDSILPNGWLAKKESSLKHGVEVVSPILYKGDEEQIEKTCSMLIKLGQYITRSCAAHVHIGSSYFDDVNSFKNLLDIFANTEGILYLISNQEGDIPRRNVFKYSTPISKKINNFNDESCIEIADIDDKESFYKIIKVLQGSRFSSINFKNLGLDNKDTIEFRIPNGTLDPNIWVENINLFGGIMYAAKKISNIQRKPINDINDDDIITLYSFEKLKDEKISERNRLKLLLNLLPEEIDKQIYINRYDVNKDLSRGLDTEDLVRYVNACRPICVSECNEELMHIVDDRCSVNTTKPKNKHKVK